MGEFADLNLEKIRADLALLEDSIITDFAKRSKYALNPKAYLPGQINIENFNGSFFESLFVDLEAVFASKGRYDCQEEHPFYVKNWKTRVKRSYDDFLSSKVNLNDKIIKAYLNRLPSFCRDADDGQYGSSVSADIICLQDLSLRIHMGEKVAEAKYSADSLTFQLLIQFQAKEDLECKLRNLDVESKNLARVRQKAERYGLNPTFIHEFYAEVVMPLTIEVEIAYLMSKQV